MEIIDSFIILCQEILWVTHFSLLINMLLHIVCFLLVCMFLLYRYGYKDWLMVTYHIYEQSTNDTLIFLLLFSSLTTHKFYNICNINPFKNTDACKVLTCTPGAIQKFLTKAPCDIYIHTHSHVCNSLGIWVLNLRLSDQWKTHSTS